MTRRFPAVRLPVRPCLALALTAALSACESQTTPAGLPDDLVDAPVSSFDASVHEASVTGSGHFRQEGQKRTFTFNAKRMPGGGVSGQYHLRTNAGQIFHGTAVCMVTVGNHAWVGVESARDGWSGGFRVEDNGEGGATPDRISFLYPGYGAQRWCSYLPGAPLYGIDAGNVQVHDPNGPKPQIVFSDDFESDARPEWSSDRLSTSPSGATFLGDFSDDVSHGVTLGLSGLRPHSTLQVTFDLYVIRTMDGNDATYGLDLFTFSEGSTGFQFQTTFSGFCGSQAFPLAYGEGDFFGCPGASAVNSLGFVWGDGVVDVINPVTLTIPHTGSTADIFIGAEGLQDFVDQYGAFSDESWGIDNVVVSIIR